MKKLLIPFSILFLMATAACNQKANTPGDKTSAASSTETKPATVKLADLATPKDLFCGMPLAEGGIADSTVYQGKIYGFCSTACKDSFLVKPESYLVQK